MLQSIPSRKNQRQVYRLSYDSEADAFLAEFQLDAQAGVELDFALVEAGYRFDEKTLLDFPFLRKRRRRQTRFSDGSFPVFYGALDSETAEAEVRHWAPQILGSAEEPRTAYYWLLACTFDGVEKDLRPRIEAWPELIHDSDYTFCNQLGAEAVQLGLDGLVTRSARRAQGVNLPVFSRDALREPERIRLVAVTLDPGTGQVSVRVVSGRG